MKSSHHSKLFDRPGYIPLREYLEDIAFMRKNGPWKLPLRTGDRAQLFFLSLVARFSWFSGMLRITYPYEWSPAYGVILSYLRRERIFDSITARDVRFANYGAYFLKKEVTVNDRTGIVSGQGASQDKATALSKALGEMIERTVSGYSDANSDILRASPESLLGKFSLYYPPKYHRFLDVQKEQYPELRHDPTKPIDWVAGMNLVTREKAYVPRYTTSWFIGGRSSKEILANSTSNGSAGYFTKTGAVLRGLLEVVHRDGFLVHWLTTIAPRVVRNDTLPQSLQETIQQFGVRGISLYILDVSTLRIPSIYIAAINELAEVPRVVLSGASALTAEGAIRDALEEMIAISPGVFYADADSSEKNEVDDFQPFLSAFNKQTRQAYWWGAEKLKRFQWFLSGESVSYNEACRYDILGQDDDQRRLRACLGVLRGLGEDYFPIVYFPKNPIQKELGFYVAQIYVPKAFPLYLLEYQGTFDSDRLEEFAQSKGIASWTLNPLPHMFS